MIAEFELVEIAIRSDGVEAIIIVISQRSTVVIIDVPVELNQQLFVFIVETCWDLTGVVLIY